MMKEPSTLTSNVPQGKASPTRSAIHTDTPYRAAVPSAPPSMMISSSLTGLLLHSGDGDTCLPHILTLPVRVAGIARLIAHEKHDLGKAFIRVDLGW